MDSQIRVADAATDAELSTIAIPTAYYNVGAVDLTTNKLYLTTTAKVEVVHLTTGAHLTTIALNATDIRGIAAIPGSGKIYVTEMLTGLVRVIDTATDTISTDITVGTQLNTIAVLP